MPSRFAPPSRIRYRRMPPNPNPSLIFRKPSPSSRVHSLLLVANSLHFIVHYYLHLLEALWAAGYRLALLVPAGKREGKYQQLPSEIPVYYLSNRQKDSGSWLELIWRGKYLVSIIAQVKPLAILSFTMAMNVPVSLAGRWLGIPVLPTLTGLGYFFTRQGIMARLAGMLCRIAFYHCPRVFFQNRADIRTFTVRDWVREDRAVLVEGAGIDRTYFRPQAYPKDGTPRTILFLGRMQGDKGLHCLVESLRRLAHDGISFECQLAGHAGGGHPTDIPQTVLDAWQAEGLVTLVGYRADVRPLLAGCHLLIQPSRREGLSRSIQEALACGRPIISSTAPGCADLVQESINGWLFCTDDAKSLYTLLRMICRLPYAKLLEMAAGTSATLPESQGNAAISRIYLEVLQEIRLCPS